MKKKGIRIICILTICIIVLLVVNQRILKVKDNYKIYKDNLIQVNLKDLNYDAQSNCYYMFRVMDKLTGSLELTDDIKRFSYRIEDENGKILLENDIDIKEKWKINNIGFVIGLNKITFEVEYYNSKSFKKEFEFLNMNENNHFNLNIDLNDNDNDGLLNYYEEFYGTNKDNADTDGDGINDYDEIYELATNPSVKDNMDYLIDIREKYKLRDTITSEPYIEKLLADNNEAIPSVKCEDNVLVNIFESRVNIGTNGVIGKIINLELDDKSNVELSFDVRKSIEKGNNINNYIICQVNNNTYMPIETIRNNGIISTNVDESGDYFVLDVNKFLNKLQFNSHEGNTVLLKNFKYVNLKEKVDKNSNIDSDGDEISDYKELGKPIKIDLGIFINQLIENEESDIYNYKGIMEIEVYDNISDPTLKDSDGDGFNDNVDPTPLEATAFKSFEAYKAYRYGDLTTLTVIDRQPYINSRTVININKLDVGHSEIRIDSNNTKEIYGFYSYEDYSIYDVLYLKSCMGKLIKNDGYYLTNTNESMFVKYNEKISENKRWNVGKTFIIEEQDIDKINKYAEDYKYKYNMVKNNCSSFVIGILDEIGIKSRFNLHNWTYLPEVEGCVSSRFNGYTPADLGQDIRENYRTYITYEDIVLADGTLTKAVVIN